MSTIGRMLYTQFLELIHSCITETLYMLNNIISFSSPPSFWQMPIYSSFYEFAYFGYQCGIMQYSAFCDWLRSKHLLILRLESISAGMMEPKKIKSVTVSIISPSICHEMMGLDAMIFDFWMLNFKPAFSLSFHFHQENLVPLCFCHKDDVICISVVIAISPAILIPVCASSSPAFCIMYSA